MSGIFVEIVISASQVTPDKPDFWSLVLNGQSPVAIYTDNLIVPVCIATASAAILIFHALLSWRPVRQFILRLWNSKTSSPENNEQLQLTNQSHGILAQVREHVAFHGGPSIFFYMVFRLLGSLALFGLSTVALVPGERGGTHEKKEHSLAFTNKEWLQVSSCLTFLYTSLLGLIAITAKPRWSRLVTRHFNAVLLSAFGIYFYRDLFPLLTYTLPMQDTENCILWAKIVLLGIVAVLVPLIIPRAYIPVGPENPMPLPSPEQTAPLISMMLHSYLDPLVMKAYRIPHLPFDQLPPLADYDTSQVLKARSFPHLDVFSGAKKRHIFFGLMRVFRWDYTVLAIMILVHVCGTFAGPIGINRLLYYIEHRDDGEAFVRPIVWILWLFFGPVVASIAIQWYIFIATRIMVRAEAIMTQLVFEHSLRVRVKASTTNSSGQSTAPTPDNASFVDDAPSTESIGSNTLHGTSDAVSTDSRDKNVDASTENASSSNKITQESPSGQTPAASQSDTSNLVGKINNLVTTDLGNIIDARDFLLIGVYVPVQITLCICFLYIVLGWSAFVGLAFIIVMLPIPGFVAKFTQTVQEQRLKKTDGRVQTVTETMNVLRMIKLFGWEKKMNDKIAEQRDEELVWIKKRKILDLLNGTINFVIPIITMTIVMKQQLSASKVFSSMSVFDMLRDQLHMVFNSITDTITGKVSLDRMTDFLRNTELLDSYTEKDIAIDLRATGNHEVDASQIGFRNASFVWSSDADGSFTSSKRKFLLKIDNDLIFQRGHINLVVGPTGSGKTSLLMALLGEMHFIPAGSDAWFNLPRDGGVAYAAQESWVQNETIKANILFGSPYDEARYKKVIYQCGLERDISLFEAGDLAEVGEKGLTLSGGQKARVTLARAIYSRAQIILLDDVLAALDVHTAKWIVDKCFTGDLTKGRTVILVTHNVAMARPIANFVVSIKNGRVASQGSISDALAHDALLTDETDQFQKAMDKVEEEIDSQPPPGAKKSDGKLIVAEEIEEGHIGVPALIFFFSSLGGSHVWLFFASFIGGLAITEILNAAQTWWLGHWASQYDDRETYQIPVFFYISIYSSFTLFAALVYAATFMLFVVATLRSSRTIHRQLIQSVLGTTLRWLDTTPTSRVIARCTQDIRALDGPITMWFMYVVEISVTMLVKFVAVVVVTPLFLFPSVIVALAGAWCGQMYIKAQLSVKREMSNAKSPVLSQYVYMKITYSSSIRAYGVQEAFAQESLSRINRYTRTARTFYNLNRWVCIRIDTLGGLFAATLAVYLVYFQDRTASTTGFSLNMAIGFSGLILWWVRTLNEFEVQGYVTIEQEPKPTAGGAPPAYWPTSGKLVVEDLTARYSPDGPAVLHNISFTINSGERIGVVGRTGSGKSSLTLSLLRCIYTDGNIYYDGLPTSSVNLDALRSSITIIPQMPELLSGSLRQNLDPFDQYDDATLNDALGASGLFSLQDVDQEGFLNLDSTISSGGSNLSVGQRQIIALARAIVRDSKLLILDEATSAIDYKTDTVIQSSLRNELKGDVTLITVAHRLQTIMDADRILVLDAGNIVEYDSPSALLKKENGHLRAMVDESNDRDTLYAMAEGKKITL
ncbi:P-loop containing nucleoside triphosphate hydrolase protein [Guyanagaster necrorhizus]|uniref:P-loop containing nucleoside triphosphate hydrolase protein n=1 Tax=Guyanagaster necrorhizus TaxID=856835 RepID=A0A9P7W072_9AGAR|nr:P-loop containing nucleoside triphosphate hydrolase protein [Guyanagaster necrorhizus MCA 3950]KAG7450174.1 P-loop containing nucleoside triphosphate hydrolase protein [Guyanagaster necrorhizus MCA 3950]